MANNVYSRPHPNMHNSMNMRNSGGDQGCGTNCGGSSSNNSSCEELMIAIMEADFFAQDLKLYLDTHPDDTKAIEMFREAVRQSKACKATFEDSFYPLTASGAGTEGTWDWLDGSFPPCT